MIDRWAVEHCNLTSPYPPIKNFYQYKSNKKLSEVLFISSEFIIYTLRTTEYERTKRQVRNVQKPRQPLKKVYKNMKEKGRKKG